VAIWHPARFVKVGEEQPGCDMTIVIQQIETRRFLADRDEWVSEARDALPFSDTRHALSYCRRHALENVRLVVFFRDKKVSLLLYVPGSDTPAPAGAMRAVAA
jgi:hypothetical protein